MNEMQGQLCGSRPMRLSNATPKAKAQNHNFNDRVSLFNSLLTSAV